MAGLSATGGPQLGKMVPSCYPTLPPKAPNAAVAYSRSINEAPLTALVGVKGPKQPDKHKPTSRCRMRNQVGLTNRWRLPEYLGSDLLGSAQAIKAIRSPLNKSLIKIMTAEGPKLSLNLDVSQPYKFRQSNDRPKFYTSCESTDTSAKEDAVKTGGEISPTFKPPRVPPITKYTPVSARALTPKDIFQYFSKRSQTLTGPDVILHCLEMDWELHRPFLKKSHTLSEILKVADGTKPLQYYPSSEADPLHRHVQKSNFFSSDFQTLAQGEMPRNFRRGSRKSIDNTALLSSYRVNNVTVIELDIVEPLVTVHALAIALGNLYLDDTDVEVEDVVGVMAAAHVLGYKALREGCATVMLSSINYHTVCAYHHVATKFHEDKVTLACEKWLEINLIPKLALHIQLRQLSYDALQKVLKSSSLFTYNEYSIYKMLCNWLFLQLNPDIQLMPCHSTILSYFNSFPKTMSFLERENGDIYEPLFSCLRLHGVTDTNHLRDMQIMNVVPQAWVVSVLSLHYQALQGGGDMTAFKNFSSAAVRQGFVLDDGPSYHSEIFSLYGFHFELKAVRQEEKGTYSFFMQRLKPNDSMLSFRDCERHTFSMRPDRLVNYSIRVQCRKYGESFLYNTRMLSQKFGLRESISRSEVKLDSFFASFED